MLCAIGNDKKWKLHLKAKKKCNENHYAEQIQQKKIINK